VPESVVEEFTVNGVTLRIRIEVSKLCPCGGTYWAGYTEPSDDAVVLHSQPYCQAFDKLEPDRYLTKCRLWHEAKMVS
jgi:hypothetical protein